MTIKVKKFWVASQPLRPCAPPLPQSWIRPCYLHPVCSSVFVAGSEKWIIVFQFISATRASLISKMSLTCIIIYIKAKSYLHSLFWNCQSSLYEMHMDPALDRGSSYNVYRNWELIPMIAVSGGISLLSFVFAAIVGVYAIRNPDEPMIGKEFIIGFIKIFLKIKKKDETTEATLYKRKVSTNATLLFFMAAVFVMLCSFLAFWEIFLIENSFTCTPGLDCFAFDSHRPISKSSISRNCSSFESLDNITIICYKFVYRYSEGLGTAGGLIVYASFMLKAYAAAYFWFLDLDCSEGICKCFRSWCKAVLICFLSILPTIIWAALLGVSFRVPSFYEMIIRTNSGAVQFIAFMFTLFYIITFGVLGISLVARSELYFVMQPLRYSF